MSTIDPMRKLQSISDKSPPRLPGYSGKAALTGSWRGLSFIATEDHDGHIEVSLSRKDRLRVTGQQARSFFNWLGTKPQSGRADMTLSAHWVLRKGAIQ